MQVLKWSRAFGDIIFATGAVALVVFVFGLAVGYSLRSVKKA
jgi:nitric oxide reductase large subunit